MPLQFDPNASFVRPQDAMGLLGGGLPTGFRTNIMNMANGSVGGAMQSQQTPGMNNELMGLAKALPNQAATQPTGMSEMDMYRMAAGALQGMGKNQQPQQMPQLPILRDSNQFRFAGMQQNPQMLAQALRNRG